MEKADKWKKVKLFVNKNDIAGIPLFKPKCDFSN